MEGEREGEDGQDEADFLPPLPAGGALAPRLGLAPESLDQPDAGDQPVRAAPDPAKPDDDQQASKPDETAVVRPKPVWKPPTQPPPWRRPVPNKGTPATAQAPDNPGANQPVARQGTGLTLPASTNARSKRVPQKIQPRARQQPDLSPSEKLAHLALSVVMVLTFIGLVVAWIIVALGA